MSPEAHPSSDIEAQKTDVLDMPSHWIFKRDGHPLNHTYFCWWPPLHFLHHLMCAIGWGHGSLVEFWELCHPRCPLEVWEHERDLVGGRLEHLNTVAVLLLATTATFCTTEPPGNGILPYTKTGPYCVLLVSVAFSLGGLIVGSTAVFVNHKLKSQWFHETMMGSRFRIWTTMFLLSFPFIAVGVSTCTTAAALLIAASYSGFKLVRIGCYILIAPPLLCGIGFGWMVFMKTGSWGRLMGRLRRRHPA